MKIIDNVRELNEALSSVDRSGVGFVPTMGALHAGHRSLVERCAAECQTTVVSVFVNPTQFNDKNDLKSYPRTPERDVELLRGAGADIVFMPSVEEVYPQADTRVFDFGPIDKVMEGASRPGHFNGVAQVVSRLFDLVKPAKAYFGEKDFQQIAIIREMVRQLNLPVQIVDCAIVRGEDGLALSSRNALLTPEYRAVAPQIYASLCRGVEAAPKMTPNQVEQYVTELIQMQGVMKVVYFEIVDARTMQRIANWSDSDRVQGCITVQVGNVRLIDNIRFK